MPHRKRKGSRKDVWDSVHGWKKVDIGEDFLVGSEEAGFMGLEELDPSCLGNVSLVPVEC